MYNAQNLSTRRVLQSRDERYVFVHKDHPAIVPRANQYLINGEYYKCLKLDFETSCNNIARHLHAAILQRRWRVILTRRRAIALCMGTHERLGRESPLCDDVLQLIAAMTGYDPR